MKSAVGDGKSQTGFTVVELLVVIAVIVVLLAMLAPALERALTQAQMAVCAANLHSIANATHTYCHGNRRFYPDRTLFTDPASDAPGGPAGGNHPGGAQPGDLAHRSWDDRAVLRKAFPMSILRDPMVKAIDLDAPRIGTTWYMGSYELWFSFGYRLENFKRKLGDDFTFRQTPATGPITYRFDVLAGDYDLYIDNTSTRSVSSHVDSEGISTNVVANYWSYWDATNRGRRGTLDVNYVHDDGAVARHNGVKIPQDERMVTVPYMSSNYSYPVVRFQIPARR